MDGKTDRWTDMDKTISLHVQQGITIFFFFFVGGGGGGGALQVLIGGAVCF